ncbi:hypothetical protein D3C86_2227270 [compost metagenome]
MLTAAVETPISRPAALRLGLAASAEKKPSSAGWMVELICYGLNFKLTMDSL